MTALRWNLVLAIPAALSVLALDVSPASADRTRHVRGGVRARPYERGGARRAPHRHVVVHRSYPSYYWSGGIALGFGYASPPPPPPCYTECGPSYYPQPAVVAAPMAPEPPLPRFGLGVFGGGTTLRDGDEGQDVGLFGRFRVTPHLVLEGEIAKSELFEGRRVDRTMGGALLYDFAPWNDLSLYVLGGMGAGATEVSDNVSARHVYGELGLGVDWRLSDRLSLIADVRAGQRDGQSERKDVLLIRDPATAPLDQGEEYSRGRLGLLLSF